MIGDKTQKGQINLRNFLLFDHFDFNAAISSCYGFITSSSSSILQALLLNIKTGIVDKFDNGFYEYLVTQKATTLINDEKSFQKFLDTKKSDVTDSILNHCGLKNNNEEFDEGAYLINCLKKNWSKQQN